MQEIFALLESGEMGACLITYYQEPVGVLLHPERYREIMELIERYGNEHQELIRLKSDFKSLQREIFLGAT